MIVLNLMPGTDTAGSVRVPAAFCGILGFRPSHGAVPVVGVLPMAQSFDTVGRSTLLINFTLHERLIVCGNLAIFFWYCSVPVMVFWSMIFRSPI